MSTIIIIKVDLHCNMCYKKIKKTLCKLQDKGKIQSIVYDEKNDVVSISTSSDPKMLIKKICYDACKVIKDIQIVEPKPAPPPPEPEPAPPAPEPAPPAPEPEPAPPAPEPEPAPPAPEPEPAPPAPEPEPAPPAPEPQPPQKDEPNPPKPEPEVKPPEPVYPYPTPGWTPGPAYPVPVCCYKPWFEAFYGGCRCCSCGCIYGGPTNCGRPPPPIYDRPCYDEPRRPCYDEPRRPCYDEPQFVCGGSSYYDGPKSTCQFVCEEEQSCRIM